MLEHLKLQLPECEYIDLSQYDLLFDEFYLECVKYYKKYSHITQSVNIKTYNPQLSVEEQVCNFYTGYTYDCDSYDSISKILKIGNQQDYIDEFPNEHAYRWFNNDILQDYEIISNTITKIETVTGLRFGHIKLRYVKPQHAETIHIDYGDVRYHLPIVTNDSVFFVSNNNIFHMRDTHKLYVLDTTKPHTIVNANGSLGRLHLVCTPVCDYSFTLVKIKDATEQYSNFAKDALTNIKPHETELNKDVYYRARIMLLKLKKS